MNENARWTTVDRLLALAIDEDVGAGDITTEILVPKEAKASGHFVSRASGVFAGLDVASRLFSKLNPAVVVTRLAKEGERVKPGQKLAKVEGPARSILTGERTALNLLQRMSGVATLTRAFVDAVEGTGAKIVDTRKTAPGMRVLDKLAVYIGGGENHRAGLHDMVLIKDNHLALNWPKCPAGSTACAVTRAREATKLPIMVEVESLDQLREVLEVEPDYVLLDNMTPDMLEKSVHLARQMSSDKGLRRPLLEASGGINLSTVRRVAETGVDRISVGALTHSAVALDIALDFEELMSK